MKIKEAVNKINKLKTVSAYLFNEDVRIFSAERQEEDWFLSLDTGSDSWDDVADDYDAIYDTDLEDLARVFNIVQQLLDTPVEERTDEKKYYVKIDRGMPWSDYVKSAFSQIDVAGFKLTDKKSEAGTFTKSELDRFPFSLKIETEEAGNDR